MLEKLEPLEKEYQTLEQQLADPAVLANPTAYQRITKRYAEMGHLIETIRAYKQALAQREETRELLSDPELEEIARADLEELEGRIRRLEGELELLLLPKDPLDEKNAIVEVRAGTGGGGGPFCRRVAGHDHGVCPPGSTGWRFWTPLLTDPRGVSKVVFGVSVPRRIRLPEVRGGGAPGAAGSSHRDPRPHPHLHRHRGGDARG